MEQEVSAVVPGNPETEPQISQSSTNRKYKVWLSATSTINSTLEVEAASPEEAREKAFEIASECQTRSQVDWYYEGSGDCIVDPPDIFPVDLVPTREEQAREELRGLFPNDKAFFIRHSNGFRVYGEKEVTSRLAAVLGLKTSSHKNSPFCWIPDIAAGTLAFKINSILGQEICWQMLG